MGINLGLRWSETLKKKKIYLHRIYIAVIFWKIQNRYLAGLEEFDRFDYGDRFKIRNGSCIFVSLVFFIRRKQSRTCVLF